jgi:hypothetical protein
MFYYLLNDKLQDGKVNEGKMSERKEENFCAKSFSAFLLLDSLPALDAHNGGKKERKMFSFQPTHLLLFVLVRRRFQIIP